MSTPQTPGNAVAKKRVVLGQEEFPNFDLGPTLAIPRAIIESYAGHATSPLYIAAALKNSPTSSTWRYLTGAAVAYGLTKGAYRADVIEHTPLSKRILEPSDPSEGIRAKREAIMKPRIMREFYDRFKNTRFPDDIVAGNVLVELGLPRDRVQAAIKVLRQNASQAEIFKEINGVQYIDLSMQPTPGKTTPPTPSSPTNADAAKKEAKKEMEDSSGTRVQGTDKLLPPVAPTAGGLDLHINVQIHISPDAKPEQIDQIFASMSKHLRGIL